MNDHDLLVLYNASTNKQTLEEAVECLHKILLRVECYDAFCHAHELVMRTKITSKPKKILKAVALDHLKPFHFLINKN